MFSFFRSSKKASPLESPENSDASSSLPANIGDDYVLIDQRGPSIPNPYSMVSGGGGPGGIYPALAGSGDRKELHRQQSEVISYLQGVPFKLSPLIRATGDSDPMEVWGFEVDQILANLTRAVDLCAQDDSQ